MAASPHGDSAEQAARIERRWASLSVVIVVFLVVMAAFVGIHQATMPQGQVEPADPRTLHVSGEFIESNLGTAVEPDGSAMVRAIGQQYSLTPQCIVVPTDTEVKFRATSADVVHDFLIDGTSVKIMLVPGYISTATTLRDRVRASHAMPRILRHRARGHVGQDQGDRQGGVREDGVRSAETDLC